MTLFFHEGIELCEGNEILSSHGTFNTISLCFLLLITHYGLGVSFFYAFISVFSLLCVCAMHSYMCEQVHVLLSMLRPQEDVGYPVSSLSAMSP